jgi:hypothetical protein
MAEMAFIRQEVFLGGLGLLEASSQEMQVLAAHL